MTATAKHSLRWSSARSCPRMAVYEATTPPERDWTLSEERIMWRGNGVGHDFAVRLAAATLDGDGNGRVYLDSAPDPYRQWPEHLLTDDRETAGFIVERKVPWLAGVGHVDVYATATETVIEVLSSRYSIQAHSKLLQAVGYAGNIPECKAVCLVIVDPSDLSEERVIVTVGSDEWEQLFEECHQRLDEIRVWTETGDMPSRVCSKPSEARSHWCRYSTTCFEGWTPEPLAALDDPEVQRLATELAQLKAKRKTGSAVDKVLEKAQKLIQDELAAKVEPGKWVTGGVKLERSVRSRPSFKLTLAKEDSRLPADLLDEFTEVSEYDVWSAELLDGEGALRPADEDFGDVPF